MAKRRPPSLNDFFEPPPDDPPDDYQPWMGVTDNIDMITLPLANDHFDPVELERLRRLYIR